MSGILSFAESDHIVCVDYNSGIDNNGSYVLQEHSSIYEAGNISIYSVKYTRLQGWFGSNLCDEYLFGYSINDNEIVTNESFSKTYEEPVRNAIDNNVPNATFYSRYVIDAPVANGTYVSVKYYAIPKNDTQAFLLGETIYKNPSPKIEKISHVLSINDTNVNCMVLKSNGLEDNTIKFEESAKLTINASVTGKFNKISVDYSLNTPISAKVMYTVDNKDYEDTLIFPVAENGSITQTLKGFMTEKKASKIRSITFENKGTKTALLKINSITTDTIEIPSETEVTLKNNNIYAVIDLNLGGKLTYIGVVLEGYENIVNVASEANEEILIDYKAGTNYVYLKTISEKLQAYVEKRYILRDNYIEVQNKVECFGKAPNGESLIETSSFNVLGSFNTFAYYPGENSWNGGTLKRISPISIVEDYNTSNRTSGNTETWGALINSDGSGFGIYEPNVESFSVGVISEDTNKVSSNVYVVCDENKTFTYTYLIATGKVDEIREIFKVAKDSISTEWVSQNDFVPPAESTEPPLETPVPTNTPVPSTPTPTAEPEISTKREFTGNWGVVIFVVAAFLVVVMLIIVANYKMKNEK